MATINRAIETEHDRKMLLNLISSRPVPFTLSLTDGKHRSNKQNKTQRLWMNEISAQLGDRTPEEVRGECKLTLGVPILRQENEVFRIRYDEVVKPLSYQQKLAIMMEPLDLPITRLFTTRQHAAYLESIIRHYSAQGVVLTIPDDLGLEQFRGAA
jgi:hypothetical protein